MKYSRYNVIIPYEGKFALYNTFEQKVIFLEEKLKDLLEKEKTHSLEKIHPTFYEHLLTNHFIVKKNVNELNKVKKLSQKVDGDPQSYLLTINPTMNCNFKCWYCYESLVKNSRIKEAELEKIKLFIYRTASERKLKDFNLSFFGGEPLLYFKKTVIPIVDYFLKICEEKKKVPYISFTTNGYLIDQDFIDYFISKNIRCHLQITLDGYREQHDKVRFVHRTKGSYHTIVSNIKLLIKNGFDVKARVNYTDENLENTHKITDDFQDVSSEIKKNYLIFDFHRVWQNSKLDDTSVLLEKEIRLIQSKGFTASSFYTPNSVLESCYADKLNSVVINYNGDIFKCTARDFSHENSVGYLSDEGELIWKDDHLEKRMNAKFKNAPCLTCEILPLCNGGCSQHALEHLEKGEYCVYYGDEGEKTKIIKAKVTEIVANVQEK